MASKSFYIWNAVAISGTTTYKSAVIRLGEDEDVFIDEETTSTATGTLSLEENNLPDDEYDLAVGAAAGATIAAREAANTTGWQQFDLSPTATVAVTAGLKNTFALEQPMPKKLRFSYTNATNSGAITAKARKRKR